MFCSTVIPTIARPTLTRAVCSVLEQETTSADFEVIVVNDSGTPLPPADWQASSQVKVIQTDHRERSVARNTGAAIARGRYLHFLDDDDWLVPGALESLWRLTEDVDDAIWFYGGTQLVDREGQLLIQLRHGMSGNCFIQVMAGEWIPLQSSLVEADAFFRVGGFNPLLSGTEDVDLCRRMALVGNMVESSAVVACVGMGEEDSSTDHERSPIVSRWAREAILEKPGVLARMRRSATGDYWVGRMARVYLTSVVWNLEHKRLFGAASRAMFALASLILAGRYLFSTGFWHAVVRPYTSETFIKGFHDAGLVE